VITASWVLAVMMRREPRRHKGQVAIASPIKMAVIYDTTVEDGSTKTGE